MPQTAQVTKVKTHHAKKIAVRLARPAMTAHAAVVALSKSGLLKIKVPAYGRDFFITSNSRNREAHREIRAEFAKAISSIKFFFVAFFAKKTWRSLRLRS